MSLEISLVANTCIYGIIIFFFSNSFYYTEETLAYASFLCLSSEMHWTMTGHTYIVDGAVIQLDDSCE